jgi:hypothetical protein
MADPQNEKERITSKLARVRNALSDQTLLVRRNLDVGRQMSDSVRRHSWGWMSIAAIFGWLLSRLPARKKKIYVQSSDSLKPKNRGMGISGHLWKGVWSIAKPVLTAYLTSRVAAKLNIPGAKWF